MKLTLRIVTFSPATVSTVRVEFDQFFSNLYGFVHRQCVKKSNVIEGKFKLSDAHQHAITNAVQHR